MIATCFFPAGFAALSRMGSPRIKNVAISFTASLGILLGGGAIPAGIGLIGELGSFSLGFILLGGLLLAGVVLVQFLKFSNE
jgi:NNP family nitrate/nitrite transporter-like MFS transporter